jgi:hypothetical protein
MHRLRSAVAAEGGRLLRVLLLRLGALSTDADRRSRPGGRCFVDEVIEWSAPKTGRPLRGGLSRAENRAHRSVGCWWSLLGGRKTYVPHA